MLLITSALLIVLFGVSARAGGQTFRLATRGLEGVDRRVGEESLRALLRGIRLPRAAGQPAFEGGATELAGVTAPEREVACAGPGLSTTLRLALDVSGGRTRLVCRRGGGSAVLLDLGARTAHFSYALAGRAWVDSVVATAPSARPGAVTPEDTPARRLWIRLATADGAFEVVEAVEPSPAARAAT